MERTSKRLGLWGLMVGVVAAVLLALAVTPAFAVPSTGTPGWLKDSSGAWYYYDSDGNLAHGLVQMDNDAWYYLDTTTGAMKTGWIETTESPSYYGEPVWMYFIPPKGNAATGWYQVGSKWYKFDSDGVMQTGWVKSGGKWYYMKPSGAMATGWYKVNGEWYYFSSSGVMQTGWKQIGGKWYWFDSSGAAACNEIITIGGKNYCFDKSCAMKTGWVKDGYWYYFTSGGAAATGWQKISGTWYFFNPDGTMLTGWKATGGARYYFKPSGAMASAEWLKINVYDENKEDYVNHWFYFFANGKTAFGTQTINGKTYNFHEEYGYLL